MKCPKCKKEIEKVVIVSCCDQFATVDEDGEIIEWDSVEEIGDSFFAVCRECNTKLKIKGEFVTRKIEKQTKFIVS